MGFVEKQMLFVTTFSQKPCHTFLPKLLLKTYIVTCTISFHFVFDIFRESRNLSLFKHFRLQILFRPQKHSLFLLSSPDIRCDLLVELFLAGSVEYLDSFGAFLVVDCDMNDYWHFFGDRTKADI